MMDATVVPTDEDLAKLERSVRSARSFLRSQQNNLLRKNGDFLFPQYPSTQISLSLFPVPDLPDDGDEEAEELQRMVVLMAMDDLGKTIESLEVAKEERRVDAVVKAREEEINFGINVDDCPICLDPLHAGHFDRQNMCYMPCCGKETCFPCFEKCNALHFKECPLCRHKFPVTAIYAETMKHKLAKTMPRFQFLMGRECFDGNGLGGGISNSNDQKALKYMTEAAEGGNVEAQAFLGWCYDLCPRRIVKRSLAKSLYWRELAASNGHIMAHLELSTMYRSGGGCEKNIQLYYSLATFAAHHGNMHAQLELGQAYLSGNIEGIPKSFERAKYWIGKIVHSPETEITKQLRQSAWTAYIAYFNVLLFLLTQNVSGVVDVGGQCPVPEALHWLHKAERIKSLSEMDANLLKLCKEVGEERCFNCKSSLDAPARKRKCSRCHWAHYCGRECQLQHWNFGHKKDCKKIY